MAEKKTSKSIAVRIAMMQIGLKQTDIAKKFNVSRQHINNIINGRTTSKPICEYIKTTLGIEL